MENNKTSYNWSSDENEDCIFKKPLDNILNAKFLSMMIDRKKEIEVFHKTEDERAKSITGACLLENQIDEILSYWIPGYEKLLKDNETTFAYKIKLCKALQLFPSKIIDCVDVFRQIRNVLLIISIYLVLIN